MVTHMARSHGRALRYARRAWTEALKQPRRRSGWDLPHTRHMACRSRSGARRMAHGERKQCNLPKPLDGQHTEQTGIHVPHAIKEATHVSNGVVVHEFIRRRTRGVVRGVGRGRDTPNTRDDRQKQRNTRNHGRLQLKFDSTSKVPPFCKVEI